MALQISTFTIRHFQKDTVGTFQVSICFDMRPLCRGEREMEGEIELDTRWVEQQLPLHPEWIMPHAIGHCGFALEAGSLTLILRLC